LLLVSCGFMALSHAGTARPRAPKTTPSKASFTRVPILMYHRIDLRKSRYSVTPQNFRRHLRALYRAGYSTISLEEYVTGDMSGVPRGRRPIVLTFDDGTQGQLNYIETKRGPKLDPNCAVAIIMRFEAWHPDFRYKAAFFIVPRWAPFGQKEYVADKIHLIMNLGMEIGNHTRNHRYLYTRHEEKVRREIVGFQEGLEKIIGPRAKKVKFVAYPFGASPRDEHIKKIFPKVTYKGKSHTFLAAFHAWKGPAPYPMPEKLRWRIPRIEAQNRLPEYLFAPAKKPTVIAEKRN